MKIRRRTRAGAVLVLVMILIVGFVSYSFREPYPSGNLQLNTEFQFVVGEKFHYKTNKYLLSGPEDLYEQREEVFRVNRTKEVDGREYYEIVYNLSIHIWETDTVSETVTNVTLLFYFNIENGTCLGKNIDPSRYTNEDGLATDLGFFAFWMLALEKDFRWQLNDEVCSKMHRIDVLAMDDVNGTHCFKVRIEELLNARLNRVRQLWIDSKKRIVIKEETNPLVGDTVYRDMIPFL
jgi:hypothetical protein